MQATPVPLYPALHAQLYAPGPVYVHVEIPPVAQLFIPPPTPVQLFMAGYNETGRDKRRERVSQ